MRQDRRVYPLYRAGPAAEAEALEFDKIDLDLSLARSCPARGPADSKASASAAGPFALKNESLEDRASKKQRIQI